MIANFLNVTKFAALSIKKNNNDCYVASIIINLCEYWSLK